MLFLIWISQIIKGHPSINPQKQIYWIELFSGLKNTTLSRLNPWVFIIQRILSCAIVIFLVNINLILKIWLISAIQALHLLYLLIVRPYKLVKDLMFECINQLIMTIFWWILIKFNTEMEANNAINWILIGTIISSTLVLSTISIIDLTKIIICKIKKSWSKENKIKNYRQNKSQIKQNLDQVGSKICTPHKSIEENKSLSCNT